MNTNFTRRLVSGEDLGEDGCQGGEDLGEDSLDDLQRADGLVITEHGAERRENSWATVITRYTGGAGEVGQRVPDRGT
ncbi:MAG: hypothetical protein ACYDD4_11725 [Acidimicrobiales bacterium]